MAMSAQAVSHGVAEEGSPRGEPWGKCVIALHFHALPRPGLDDFDFRVAGADLLLEPIARVLLAVAEEHGARRDLSDEIQQFLTIGMGSEVEVLHFAASGDFAGAAAEHKCRTVFCRLE